MRTCEVNKWEEMATWIEQADKFANENDKNNYENIIVTHDLQDCIDDSLDKVFEHLPIINYSKYSEENGQDLFNYEEQQENEENTG